MDIGELMEKADIFSHERDVGEKMSKFSELLLAELQRMSVEEFKQCVRHKLTLEKKPKEIVVELAFKLNVEDLYPERS
ncbi:hypothetical protein [Lysinibacillus sp. LZ02]|uniref:hypothetical protein n=1 Tax=Lysinibacillus sp. LZ02 TaxID=3420668 RepID=UPI003D35B430